MRRSRKRSVIDRIDRLGKKLESKLDLARLASSSQANPDDICKQLKELSSNSDAKMNELNWKVTARMNELESKIIELNSKSNAIFMQTSERQSELAEKLDAVLCILRSATVLEAGRASEQTHQDVRQDKHTPSAFWV